LVNERQNLVKLGDNPLLLGKRWDGKRQLKDGSQIKFLLLGGSACQVVHVLLNVRRRDKGVDEPGKYLWKGSYDCNVRICSHLAEVT
jgi:hypothetical protein